MLFEYMMFIFDILCYSVVIETIEITQRYNSLT